ncbi:hypothetical protein, partial [Cronobacter sakazakii]|uniref:hypothetical protein n=1 Tax=Cronobacter sakazakii TaxID=28141 RepID=UPI0020CB2CC0
PGTLPEQQNFRYRLMFKPFHQNKASQQNPDAMHIRVATLNSSIPRLQKAPILLNLRPRHILIFSL